MHSNVYVTNTEDWDQITEGLFQEKITRIAKQTIFYCVYGCVGREVWSKHGVVVDIMNLFLFLEEADNRLRRIY